MLLRGPDLFVGRCFWCAGLLPRKHYNCSIERFAVLLFSSSVVSNCKTLSTKEKKSLAPYACIYVDTL